MNSSLCFALRIVLPTDEKQIIIGPWGHHSHFLGNVALPNGTTINGLMGEVRGDWSHSSTELVPMPISDRAILSIKPGSQNSIELRPVKVARTNIRTGSLRKTVLHIVSPDFTDPHEIILNLGLPDCDIDWVNCGTLCNAIAIDTLNIDGRMLKVGTGITLF